MTQAAQPNPVIETHWVTGDEAEQLHREVGSLVVRIGPQRGEAVWVQSHLANQLANDLARQHPGSMYTVMVPSRIYHKPPATEESEASA